MHIFLTGELRVGKSTVIDRTVALLGVCPGGFRTYFGPDREAPCHRLYLCDAGEPRQFDAAHAIAHFRGECPPEFDLPRFEALALAALQKGQAAPLLLMDECGRMEQEARRFQQTVQERLEEQRPILGVVREGAGDWLETIRRHSKVCLITVTRENRDTLPMELAARLRPQVERGE